jgi:hypothetical protein
MLSLKNTLVWIRMWIGSGFKKACIRIRIQLTLDPKQHILYPDMHCCRSHHLDADPDPACHFDADPNPEPASHFDTDPDPTFYLDADPDLAYK